MSTDNTTENSTVKFEHRFAMPKMEGRLDSYENIKAALERARSVCDILGSISDTNEIANIWRVAQTIENEILDAEEMLKAYFHINRNG